MDPRVLEGITQETVTNVWNTRSEQGGESIMPDRDFKAPVPFQYADCPPGRFAVCKPNIQSATRGWVIPRLRSFFQISRSGMLA